MMVSIVAIALVPALVAAFYGFYQGAMLMFKNRSYLLGIALACLAVYYAYLLFMCLLPGAMIATATLFGMIMTVTLFYAIGLLGLYIGLEAREERTETESRLKSAIDRAGHGAVSQLSRFGRGTKRVLGNAKDNVEAKINGSKPETVPASS